jgi:glycosyltransferase involved in cell wall biosynthesis
VVGIVVSALSPGKGHADLLRAMASASPRARNLRLWIAGDGPLGAGLREERRTLGLEGAVNFLGFRTDVPALLRAADFFCLPTHSEGLGSSILEAMSAGLPVVASRVGGVPEIVEDGRTGTLVPPGDVAALADSMVGMTAHADLRRSMGEAGADKARGFSADRTAEGTYRAYSRALDSRRVRRRLTL